MARGLNSFFDSLIKAISFILLLFQEIKLLLTGVLILILFDQITGIWKALKWKQWSWKKFNGLYTKLILYLFCIIACFIYEEYVVQDVMAVNNYLTKGIASVIGFQELSSGYLNISKITGTSHLTDYIKGRFPKLPKND